MSRWAWWKPKAPAEPLQRRIEDPRARAVPEGGHRSQSAALANQVARQVMGWHVVAGDRRRFWHDAGGAEVACAWGHCQMRLVAMPFVQAHHPAEAGIDDVEGRVVGFNPARFDEHWNLLLAQLAAIGVEIEQDEFRTVARSVNGEFDGPPWLAGFAGLDARRLAVMYAACRLCTDGLVDNAACGDIDRHEVERLHVAMIEEQRARDRWEIL